MAVGAVARLLARVTAPDYPHSRFSSARIRSRHHKSGSLRMAMDGCRGDPERGVGMCETRSLPAVDTLAMALDRLNSVVAALKCKPPTVNSGIIRLQVPITERIEAIRWLHSQTQLPRCFFSGRRHDCISSSHLFFDDDHQDADAAVAVNGNANGNERRHSTPAPNMVSVAGVGSAVFFQRSFPFASDDWRCIRRFLSKDCPFIRVYGAIRFDARTNISSEWECFGSFYFIIPQVELNEFEGSSMLAMTIAWDDAIQWSWGKAVELLQATLRQISVGMELDKEIPGTIIINMTHVPTKSSWDVAVKRALQMIRSENSDLHKVVLARCSEVVTKTDIDPIALLACLQVEDPDAFQFCLQPPDSPAFIGNTPEQLFHRKYLNVSSEALAGTRARGGSKILDLQIEHDLLTSPKDLLEFTIVRESIKRKLGVICNDVLVEPSKAVRKGPRIQHLHAQLSGRIRSEDDEFDILSLLHPTPAVCGLPTENARCFIAETEMFDRGMYAGPVGWFGGRESEFAVGIRSALVQKGQSMLIYSGAGIVEGTNPSSEWEELNLKASQFTKLVGYNEPLLCNQQINSMKTIT